ncbi:MAG: DEAD/DEAH box helicase [Proteobacteria bacterium]|nr:DEAD/DEAH box helicase [Pseudomonadota bacterium]
MNNFLEFGLPQPLLHSLKRMNYTTPTPIQAQAIPVALTGKDILGSAQTGTGKTAAFIIPLIARLLASSHETALILTPTRELATQVKNALNALLGPGSHIKTVLIIGGDPITKQIQQLKAHPRIFVGTPGRINDHLIRGTLKLKDTHFLVLDETDRMLDMGFGIQIDKIVKYLPKDRQTLMFSATMPPNIIKLSEKYLTSPERISIGSTTAPASKIKQEIIHTSESEKYGKLLSQLTSRTGSIIVFVKTKWGAEKLAGKLEEFHSVGTIHGDLRQHKRDKVIQAFRNQKHRIMVATDIASRGLDIPHIEHVINYDLPQCPEDYIHRIGRTGRAGAEGEAVNFITPQDGKKWKAIHHLMHPDKKFEEPKSLEKSGQKKRLFSSKKPFQFKKKESHKKIFKKRKPS